MRIKLCMAFLLCSVMASAQNLNDLLVAGLNDAERFANSYLAPVTEAGIYSVSNGWYNSADAKPLGGFEVSIVGNITGFKNKNDKKAFILDTADYENLTFDDGSTSRQVSTALGDIDGVIVNVNANIEGQLVSEQFELPTGLADDISFIPTGYIQASVGLIKGLEVKARFLPKINTDDVQIGLFGAGLQYDFTKMLPADKLLPVAISAVIGYTNLNGEYDFTDTEAIAGENQRIDANISTWNFSAVVSTRKIPVINFYGGLGYIVGKSETDLLGRYEVATVSGIPIVYNDPFSITNDVSGITANVGTKIKLSFFRINVDYNIAEFSTLTAGINFGFR
ncbi:DUF6588 family protein [Croceitalea rosinachiae]|uniref:DUF6588 family protein n=1 Tax=Croceitalea rosinachiae TaxID=3075596 RepID=A0ABU3AD18_9FLAO|nr:DUF6588 family protein [Croceitalea sp. F388]MDT0608079.1 DUF6588 family protein [Croceitalea sp. F388]